MRLLFKQRFFSWLDSYDIYDEAGNIFFTVKGQLAWGHLLKIFDSAGNYLGTVKERIFTFLPRFELYIGERYVGQLTKEFTFFKPLFTMDCNGWEVRGDWFEWDYEVCDPVGCQIMTASKQLFKWTDTYVIDVVEPRNALLSLMIVLAIDAVKCSESKRRN